MTNDFIRFYQLMITEVIKFLPNAAFHTKQTTFDLKFQKRRSLDHLLLKWSPMVPSPTAALVQIESWYKEVNSSPGNAARSQIAHHGMLTRRKKCSKMECTGRGRAALVILMGRRWIIRTSINDIRGSHAPAALWPLQRCDNGQGRLFLTCKIYSKMQDARCLMRTDRWKLSLKAPPQTQVLFACHQKK